MKIFVKKTPFAITFPLLVKASHTVGNIKSMIEQKEGIPAHKQMLVFLDQQLQDGFTLSQYFIGVESTLHLMEVVYESKSLIFITLEMKVEDTNVKAEIEDNEGILLD